MKTGNINQFYLERHHDFLCQIFAKWIKINVKIFEKVCQNSNKINQFYLKRKLNWISEKCITSQCSLKVPEGSFFHFYSISPFYPTNSGIFNVVLLIKIQIHLNKTWKLGAKKCAKIFNSNGTIRNLALEIRHQNSALSCSNPDSVCQYRKKITSSTLLGPCTSM